MLNYPHTGVVYGTKQPYPGLARARFRRRRCHHAARAGGHRHALSRVTAARAAGVAGKATHVTMQKPRF